MKNIILSGMLNKVSLLKSESVPYNSRINRLTSVWLLTIVGILLSITLKAQFVDDFSDGNFTEEPTWTGDQSLFVVENFQLRLNSTTVNDSTFLVTESQAIHNTEWNFWVRISFTPSDNNYPRIYLVSNTNNLRGPVNGYYIQIGKTGTDNKRIYLCRQDGQQRTEIIIGQDNLASTTNNILRIKVTRDLQGNWKVFADGSGSAFYQLQGSTTDATYTSSQYFGVFCKYTSSNINRFYFDDFYVGPIIVDTTPPLVTSIRALTNQELEVVFSEVVEATSATTLSNYIVDFEVGNPWSILQDAGNPARVMLRLGDALIMGKEYLLTVSNVKDLAGNVMEVQQIQFSYYRAQPFDVVINEIMADPTPVVALPAYEYIELFNNTEYTINLQNWIFQHGVTQRSLPNADIAPNGYLILGTITAIDQLQGYGPAAAIEGLSSTALTNSGATLIIYDADGVQIHSVTYSDQWYRSSIKIEGGWSLEQIDPTNYCGEADNWAASVDLRGGTPGTVNSVHAINPDLDKPWISKIVLVDDFSITVYFSEKMDPATIQNRFAYIADQGLGIPVSVSLHEPRFDAVTLVFSETINAHTVYELSIEQDLTDCAGNVLEAGSKQRFAIPEFPEPNDIVINEILFNPPPGCEDYIEIYNRSEKVIDLRNLRLSSQDTLLQQLTSVNEISPTGYLLFPGDYLVLTTTPDFVKSNYMTTNPRGFLQMASLPQFSNASGIAVLADPNESIIDRLVYTEGMHFALLSSYKGVALERIDFNRPASDLTNWHSASSGVGYGTPAYRNSQYLAVIPVDDPINIHPDIFSPDNDGYNDVLNISYSLSEPGYMATIVIYDVAGRMVRRLIKNQLLGTSGTYSWNGITDTNEKANIGYYIILVELYDLKGNLKQYKKTAVLGGRL